MEVCGGVNHKLLKICHKFTFRSWFVPISCGRPLPAVSCGVNTLMLLLLQRNKRGKCRKVGKLGSPLLLWSLWVPLLAHCYLVQETLSYLGSLIALPLLPQACEVQLSNKMAP